jgi:hypothetical protein
MPTVYRDRWIIILGSLLLGYFFVDLGQTDSFFQLIRQPFYLRDIGCTTLITAAVWAAVRAATVWLDRRVDWLTDPLRRSLGQFVLGFIGPTLLSLGLTFLFFEFIIGQDIAESTFPVYEFNVSLLVIAGFNLFYLGYYLYQKVRTQPAAPLPPEPTPGTPPSKRILLVNSGARIIPLPTDEVAYFFIESHAVFATQFSGQKFLVNASLDELTQDLDPRQFFRANRQVLLQRRACQSYLNEAYGKLRVEVRPPTEREVIVSQQKAPEFRKWLEETA